MEGISANYSGAGFTGMKFKAISTSQDDFNAWVAKVKATPKQLDQAEYDALTKPSQNNPVALYSTYEPNLFQKIVDKYEGMKPGKLAPTQGIGCSSGRMRDLFRRFAALP